jgi:hypothetical protein
MYDAADDGDESELTAVINGLVS